MLSDVGPRAGQRHGVVAPPPIGHTVVSVPAHATIPPMLRARPAEESGVDEAGPMKFALASAEFSAGAGAGAGAGASASACTVVHQGAAAGLAATARPVSASGLSHLPGKRELGAAVPPCFEVDNGGAAAASPVEVRRGCGPHWPAGDGHREQHHGPFVHVLPVSAPDISFHQRADNYMYRHGNGDKVTDAARALEGLRGRLPCGNIPNVATKVLLNILCGTEPPEGKVLRIMDGGTRTIAVADMLMEQGVPRAVLLDKARRGELLDALQRLYGLPRPPRPKAPKTAYILALLRAMHAAAAGDDNGQEWLSVFYDRYPAERAQAQAAGLHMPQPRCPALAPRKPKRQKTSSC